MSTGSEEGMKPFGVRSCQVFGRRMKGGICVEVGRFGEIYCPPENKNYGEDPEEWLVGVLGDIFEGIVRPSMVGAIHCEVGNGGLNYNRKEREGTHIYLRSFHIGSNKNGIR